MAGKVKLRFEDGSEKEYPAGVKVEDVVKERFAKQQQNILAVKVDNTVLDFTKNITTSGTLKLLTFAEPEGKEIFWHSASHLMTQAVLRVFKDQDIGLGVGVPTEDGFYQDYDIKELKPDDLKKIEGEMKKIVHEKLKITQKDVPKKEALDFYKKDPYKTELANAVPGDKVSLYTQGEFDNLCKGPHIPNTSFLKAFKLMKIAGAYRRGDSKNKMLTRIYGTAFPDKKMLNEYLTRLEEAKKRDHRTIGKQLDLFSFHDEAPGMPFFHDKGTYIWKKLVEYTTELMNKRNYEINMTPIILNKSLWLQSGHWNHYKENMYFTKIDNAECAVKPMNCPGNILIFKNSLHSYRELPIKAGEFGLVHRHELSGVLSGLFRVRCFTQDDAHVFCTEEQVEEQVIELIVFMDELYKAFGFEYHTELSTRPEKAMGDPKLWKLAEEKLQSALDKQGIKFRINLGDGAFYGPKIDYHLKDAIGRTWQCGTIQLDFQMPEKFDLEYDGQDGKRHRPVMLHRACLGSVERFMGILIEHFAGKLPLWINPNQVKVLPIADRHSDFVVKVAEQLKKAGLRVETDLRSESTSKKVRDAQVEKFSYILVVGDRESESGTVNVRTREGKLLGTKKVEELVAELHDEINEKKIN